MGLGISWKKAAIISAVVHLIALFIAVIFFVVVPAIQEMDTYEIDLTQSVLDDGGSGHAGGGGGNRADLFPKPLSADEVAARTKAVVANVEPSTATDIPDAVDVAAKASENKGNTSGDNSAVGGTGPGSGGGSGGGAIALANSTTAAFGSMAITLCGSMPACFNVSIAAAY